jgi:hypothetical protein
VNGAPHRTPAPALLGETKGKRYFKTAKNDFWEQVALAAVRSAVPRTRAEIEALADELSDAWFARICTPENEVKL